MKHCVYWSYRDLPDTFNLSVVATVGYFIKAVINIHTLVSYGHHLIDPITYYKFLSPSADFVFVLVLALTQLRIRYGCTVYLVDMNIYACV